MSGAMAVGLPIIRKPIPLPASAITITDRKNNQQKKLNSNTMKQYIFLIGIILAVSTNGKAQTNPIAQNRKVIRKYNKKDAKQLLSVFKINYYYCKFLSRRRHIKRCISF